MEKSLLTPAEFAGVNADVDSSPNTSAASDCSAGTFATALHADPPDSSPLRHQSCGSANARMHRTATETAARSGTEVASIS